MSARFDKLVTLLRELFQLDQPDLDFGFYRIMHAKSAEVTEFLERDLLPQVRTAFEQYRPADKAALEQELAELKAGIEKAGMDPAQSPRVQEMEQRLQEQGVDLDALEAEVHDHLYRFFRRYYTDGDFISKRVYKPGVYAVPYEGEEVKLHPKGMRSVGVDSEKVRFSTTAKEIEERLGDPAVTLASYLVSNTPVHDMEEQWGMDKAAMAARNVLFQKEDRDTYIKTLLEGIITGSKA